MKFDYVIVGSGLTGSTIARVLADAGKRVIIVERRQHGGGNVHDQVHSSGIRWHTYGPHYFRTNSDRIWKWAQRFGKFYPYEARVMSLVDGRLEHWPVQAEAIERMAGKGWKKEVSAKRRVGVSAKERNFETACLAMMPRVIYEKFVKGYTEKQWGVPARCLDAGLAKRFEVRMDGDTRLSKHKHQGIPVDGYTAWMDKMREGIMTVLGCDWLSNRKEVAARRVVFTGCVDEYFGFDEGRLKYRGQRRKETDRVFGYGQVNDPSDKQGHIRTLNYFMMASHRNGAGWLNGQTETPYTPDNPNDFEYPFPDAANRELAERYQKRAAKVKHLTVCGRLGEYRYLDMDQCIARALMTAGKLLRS